MPIGLDLTGRPHDCTRCGMPIYGSTIVVDEREYHLHHRPGADDAKR